MKMRSLLACSCTVLAALAAGCLADGETNLVRATLVPLPDQVTSEGIYFTETHRETLVLQTRATGDAVDIDTATIEDAQGPAEASVQTAADGSVELRVSADENAGLFTATLVLQSGTQFARVPIVVPIRPSPTCDDNNPCTTDWAEGSTCHHEMRASGASCDDGNACTTGDMCHEGACFGEALACSDDVECTEDRCDPQLGCTFVENDARCDDGDPCTEERCDIDGDCPHIPLPEGSVCAGAGGCDAVGFCIQGDCVESAVPDGFVCDDGNPCTGDDRCLAGICEGSTDGPAAPPMTVLEEGELWAPLCDGDFPDGGACWDDVSVAPHEVLAVTQVEGVAYTLWRTSFVTEDGLLCDPNVYYAAPMISAPPTPTPQQEQPSDSGGAVAPSMPYCGAAVYVTKSGGVYAQPERNFITAVRGAVDGALWPATPYEDDDFDSDVDGAPNEDTTEPEGGLPRDFDQPQPIAAVKFIVVSAQEWGATLSITSGEVTLDSGAFRNWSSVNVDPSIAPTRAGALAVAVNYPNVTLVSLEGQHCPYGLPPGAFDCRPRVTAFQWSMLTPGAPAISYSVSLPWSALCANEGDLVQNARVEVSLTGAVPTFFVSSKDHCTGRDDVRTGVLSDGLDPSPTILSSFQADIIGSVDLDGTRLAVTGEMACGDFDAPFPFVDLCFGGATVFDVLTQTRLVGVVDVSPTDNLTGVRSFGENQFLLGAGEAHQLVDWTAPSTADLVLTNPGFSHVPGEGALTDGTVVVTPAVRNTLTNGLQVFPDGAPVDEGPRALLLHPLSCQ